MEQHTHRAEELAATLAVELRGHGLGFAYELRPYEHGCMVHIDLPNDDGFSFTVSRNDPDGWLEILDPHDYHLPQTSLAHYTNLIARGMQPGEAWQAAWNAAERPTRWRGPLHRTIHRLRKFSS